jgi:aminoglycoside phosphotransferase (APT) family kinase protein
VLSLNLKRRQDGITKEEIKQLLSPKFDKDITKIEKAQGGLINDVFFVKVGEEELVLRVSPGEGPGRPGFEGERWALGECSKTAVPVPKVVSFGRVKTTLPKPCQYLLITKVPGRPLLSSLSQRVSFLLSGKSREQLNDLVKEAGTVLKKIHQTKTNGFGPLRAGGRGTFASWEDFLEKRYKIKGSLDYLIQKRLIGKKTGDKIETLFAKKGNYPKCPSPALLHGDFFYDHIFAHEGRISGVIDFEDCLGGDPLYDIAVFELYSELGKLPQKSAHLLEGYQKKLSPKEKRALSFYKLHKILPLIWWWREERKEWSKWIRARRLLTALKKNLKELG